jgi:hypothetical protein
MSQDTTLRGILAALENIAGKVGSFPTESVHGALTRHVNNFDWTGVTADFEEFNVTVGGYASYNINDTEDLLWCIIQNPESGQTVYVLGYAGSSGYALAPGAEIAVHYARAGDLVIYNNNIGCSTLRGIYAKVVDA